jgi:hypothetical protein
MQDIINNIIILWDCNDWKKFKSRAKRVYCKCFCWKEFITRLYCLKNLHTRSCWCLNTEWRKTHWYTWNKFLWTYDSMVKRCYNEKSKDYKNYWLKWVTVCKEWLNDVSKYIVFCEKLEKWFIKKYWVDEPMFLDKDIKSRELWLIVPIYSPETVIAVTRKENNRENHKNTIYYKWQRLFDYLWWDRKRYFKVWQRIKQYWWDLERAINTK